MALRISIVSENANRLGNQASKVFGVHGGSIGRSRENEWTLPDPERYLSGTHARVEFQAGRYILTDTSTNGTYVNGAQVPLGRFHEYTLRDGDYLRLGEYELLVSIDPATDFPPEEGAIVAYDGTPGASAAHDATAGDIGADLDLSELLEPSDRHDSPLGALARDAYGQTVGAEPPQESESVPWHMMTRPLTLERATAKTPRVTPPTRYEGEIDPGLAAFCRGAGLDPGALQPEARAAALLLAGQLLRESVLGLIELDQERAAFRDRLRIPPPADEAGAPQNFAQGVDETLLRLLKAQSKRAGAVESLRERFRDLKAESGASFAAMQAALDEFLARFDPKELEDRFERSGKRGVFATQNKAKYWEMYSDLYAGLSQRDVQGIPHWFMEAFAKAYEERLRSLAPPRRGPFGTDPVPTA